MVKVNDILDFLCEFAPFEYAENYDNVGLLIGDGEKEVKKVLVTLDVDEKVVLDASLNACDLIVSHHPLIFNPVKSIVSDNSTSKTIISLIKNDISLISMHTNFDSVSSGLCDLFLDKIATTKMRKALSGDDKNGCGRIADLASIMTLSDVLSSIKTAFSLENVKFIGDENKEIKKIAVCNGGGADFLYDAKEMGADVYISGDFKYHHARFSHENDMPIVEVPHYNAEVIFCDYVKKLIEEKFKQAVEIFLTDKNKNVWKIF